MSPESQDTDNHSVASESRGSQKGIIKTVLLYGSMFVLLLSLVSIGYYRPKSSAVANASADVLTTASDNVTDTPPADAAAASVASVDQAAAADIAASFAIQTNMPVAASVANLSISLEKQKSMAQTDNSMVSKPQIVQPSADNRTVGTYTAQTGDTVAKVAAKYRLSPQTVKWANDLASDNLEKGRVLTIPPVDGVVYTAKAGDTPQKLAKEYSANATRIVSFNDLEVSGIKPGMKLVIPDGQLPLSEQPGRATPAVGTLNGTVTDGVTAYTGGVDFSMVNATAGNRYAPGNCTWYAYERRAQLGRPVGSFWGDGGVWAISAIAAGHRVDSVPEAGAVAQWNAGSARRAVSGYYGHVGIVESINPDGTVTISEMNVAGFNTVSYVTLSAGDVDNYIH